jgi:hypothetical protein
MSDPSAVAQRVDGKIVPGACALIIDLPEEPLPKPVILHYNSHANAANKGNPAIHLLTDKQ